MVLEIAAGVCLGILAAAVLRRYWRHLLAVLVWLAIAAALVWLGTLVWTHRGKVLTAILIYGGAAALCGVLVGVPLWAYKYAGRRYPALGAMIYGQPPWDRAARLPARLVLMALFAVGIAVLGIGGLLAAAALVGVMSLPFH